jgi:hypothetical protein
LVQHPIPQEVKESTEMEEIKVLLDVIHSCVGIPAAAPISAEATKQLEAHAAAMAAGTHPAQQKPATETPAPTSGG